MHCLVLRSLAFKHRIFNTPFSVWSFFEAWEGCVGVHLSPNLLEKLRTHHFGGVPAISFLSTSPLWLCLQHFGQLVLLFWLNFDDLCLLVLTDAEFLLHDFDSRSKIIECGLYFPCGMLKVGKLAADNADGLKRLCDLLVGV